MIIYLLILLITVLIVNSDDNDDVYNRLISYQNKINEIEFSCYSDDYSGCSDQYLEKKWSKEYDVIDSESDQVMVYPMCLKLFQLGNTLGYYLNELACADLSGAHFIGVHKRFSLIESHALATQGDDQYTFFNALPTIREFNEKKSYDQVKEIIDGYCRCKRWCWEDEDAPWLRKLQLIREVVKNAIHNYLRVANMSMGTVLNENTDLVYFPKLQKKLPIIPNAVIHYRCGDNVGFGKTKYGLLPFRAFPSRIPHNVRSIYVIADSPNRGHGRHPYNSRCGVILQSLFDYLKKAFPDAIVVIKRGGDQFLDYARLAYANTTICSASTFCLWAAIANENGNVYFPLTSLVGGANTESNAPEIFPNFKWITDVEIIKDFSNFKPWTQLLELLTLDIALEEKISLSEDKEAKKRGKEVLSSPTY